MILYILIFSVIVILISFYFFFSIKNQNLDKSEERHKYFKQRQEELLQFLRNQQNKEQNDKVSDTTKAK